MRHFVAHNGTMRQSEAEPGGGASAVCRGIAAGRSMKQAADGDGNRFLRGLTQVDVDGGAQAVAGDLLAIDADLERRLMAGALRPAASERGMIGLDAVDVNFAIIRGAQQDDA